MNVLLPTGVSWAGWMDSDVQGADALFGTAVADKGVVFGPDQEWLVLRYYLESGGDVDAVSFEDCLSPRPACRTRVLRVETRVLRVEPASCV